VEEQIERFLRALAVQHRSVHTLSAYRRDLLQFTRFVQENSIWNGCVISSWRAVDADLLERYTDFLSTNLEYSQATIARKIASLHSFYAFLMHTGEADSNPVEDVEGPKQQRKTPNSLRPEEVTRLLANRAQSGAHYALRDRALLELLCSAGLRQTEIVALTTADIDWETGRLRCGARKKSRWLTLQPPALDALTRYAAEERPHLKRAAEEQTLFLNHLGKPLSRQGLWLIVQRCAAQAGVNADVTPLILRHTFALRQIESGADIQTVRRRLGLVSSASAQAYRQGARQNAPELEIDGVAVE
jgi:integrase/recombinase XerD